MDGGIRLLVRRRQQTRARPVDRAPVRPAPWIAADRLTRRRPQQRGKENKAKQPQQPSRGYPALVARCSHSATVSVPQGVAGAVIGQFPGSCGPVFQSRPRALPLANTAPVSDVQVGGPLGAIRSRGGRLQRSGRQGGAFRRIARCSVEYASFGTRTPAQPAPGFDGRRAFQITLTRRSVSDVYGSGVSERMHWGPAAPFPRSDVVSEPGRTASFNVMATTERFP